MILTTLSTAPTATLCARLRRLPLRRDHRPRHHEMPSSSTHADDARTTYQQVLNLPEDVFPDPTNNEELFDTYLQMTTRFLSNLIPAGSITIAANPTARTMRGTHQPLRSMRHTTGASSSVLENTSLLSKSSPSHHSSSSTLDFRLAGGSRL